MIEPPETVWRILWGIIKYSPTMTISTHSPRHLYLSHSNICVLRYQEMRTLSLFSYHTGTMGYPVHLKGYFFKCTVGCLEPFFFRKKRIILQSSQKSFLKSLFFWARNLCWSWRIYFESSFLSNNLIQQSIGFDLALPAICRSLHGIKYILKQIS